MKQQNTLYLEKTKMGGGPNINSNYKKKIRTKIFSWEKKNYLYFYIKKTEHFFGQKYLTGRKNFIYIFFIKKRAFF